MLPFPFSFYQIFFMNLCIANSGRHSLLAHLHQKQSDLRTNLIDGPMCKFFGLFLFFLYRSVCY